MHELYDSVIVQNAYRSFSGLFLKYYKNDAVFFCCIYVNGKLPHYNVYHGEKVFGGRIILTEKHKNTPYLYNDVDIDISRVI